MWRLVHPVRRTLLPCASYRRFLHKLYDKEYLMKSFEGTMFNLQNIKIDLQQRIKISIDDPAFRGMPIDEQHKRIRSLLPADVRKDNDLFIELSDTCEKDDGKVQKIYLREIVWPPATNIVQTPQSLLDAAVYQVLNRSGMLACETMWLCGSLALKIFCRSNFGRDPTSHHAKNILIDFLFESSVKFGSSLDSAWNALEDCHQNGYEYNMTLKAVRRKLKKTESFCNLLFDIHEEGRFSISAFEQFANEETEGKVNGYFPSWPPKETKPIDE